MARKPPQRTYTRTFVIEAPYAKEYRTLLDAVTHNFDVEITDAPRVAEGQYRRGTEVTIAYKRRREFDSVVACYDQARDEAVTGLADAVDNAPTGEDLATYKSSWLYGFALGLADIARGTSRSDEEIVVAVHQRIKGSGALAGFRAAAEATPPVRVPVTA